MNEINEIKRRHKLRTRQMNTKQRQPTGNAPSGRHDHSNLPQSPSSGHPLFNMNLFIIKCFVAAILVLGGALMYKTHVFADYPSAKQLVQKTLTKEMNFTVVSGWYEKMFGEPLAFLPMNQKDGKTEVTSKQKGNQDFAVPVSGTVTEQFSTAKKGVTYRTQSNAVVEAVSSGIVISVGKKDDIGKTVVVQHEDGKESWYGKLKSVDVKQYDTVKKGQKIGTVTADASGDNGTFYFALKNGDKFVDPIQVIAH
ncbi:stage IV sporulation protein FA [Pullulanibacillus pueri]|uniref:Stage IV sporulation protein FA n=1 Tax=Pullulanibacillus pueri TaxID=1437324 RepID=A0A8J3EN85_9BACL|nr:M23 family metallopeptidase [Pullulanibacillus pueri]MBM7683287.1 stage IV sporulation protein FA [Pullulanibacillus pueri]GGH85838.1 stage IV sporulation protein FA [Pullulanibacillus pueri]